jgi:HEAT repeat protein
MVKNPEKASGKDALLRVYTAGDIEELSDVLNDRTLPEEIRVGAARLLGGFHSVQALEPLVAILLSKDEEPKIHLAVAQALEELFSETDFLANEWDDIVYALQKVPLERILTVAKDNETNNLVRTAAVHLFEWVADEHITQALLPILTDRYENAALRSEAVGPIMSHPTDEVADICLTILQDKSESVEVRTKIAFYLRYNKEIDSVGALISILMEGKDDPRINSLQHEATVALGHLGDKRAVLPLIDILGREDSLGAAWALGELGDSRAIRPLLNAFPTAEPGYAQAILGSLGKLKAEEGLELLFAQLAGPNSHMRYWAALALGDFGDERALDPLIAAFEDAIETGERSRDRQSIAFALGKLKHPRAIDTLLHALTHENRLVRSDAASALIFSNSPEAIMPLIRALDDEASNVRMAAAQTLGALGDERALAALQAAKLRLAQDTSDDTHFEKMYVDEAIGRLQNRLNN